MTKWLILAVLAQAADAAVTCEALSHPHRREANPLLPSSCAGIVAVKAGATASLFGLSGRAQTIGAGVLIGSGVAGVTFTVILSR